MRDLAPATLGELAALREIAGEMERDIVRELRAQGVSWKKIGAAIGTSAATAQRRYGALLVT